MWQIGMNIHANSILDVFDPMWKFMYNKYKIRKIICCCFAYVYGHMYAPCSVDTIFINSAAIVYVIRIILQLFWFHHNINCVKPTVHEITNDYPSGRKKEQILEKKIKIMKYLRIPYTYFLNLGHWPCNVHPIIFFIICFQQFVCMYVEWKCFDMKIVTPMMTITIYGHQQQHQPTHMHTHTHTFKQTKNTQSMFLHNNRLSIVGIYSTTIWTGPEL